MTYVTYWKLGSPNLLLVITMLYVSAGKERKGFQNNDNNNDTQQVISYRNVLSVVPEVFMDNLTELINGHEASSVDSMVEHLTNVFLETIDKHAPLKKKRVKLETQPIWFNRDIQLWKEIKK